MKLVEVPLNKIVANPYRRIDKYEIDPEKIEALKQSIEETQFWCNVLARERNGKFEIAYGHHRLHALREKYGENSRRAVGLLIDDLDDETMLKIMAKENLEEWGTSFLVIMETVAATVDAYAAGTVKIPRPAPKVPQTKLRFAPSFIKGGRPDHLRPPGAEDRQAFTAQGLSVFLGIDHHKTKHACNALELVEQGFLKESDFKKIGSEQARSIIQEAAQTARAAVAQAKKDLGEKGEKITPGKVNRAARRSVREVTAEIAQGLRSGTMSRADSHQAGRAKRQEITGGKELPDVVRFVDSYSRSIHHLFTEDAYGEKLSEIIKYKKHVPDQKKLNLKAELDQLVQRIERFGKKL